MNKRKLTFVLVLSFVFVGASVAGLYAQEKINPWYPDADWAKETDSIRVFNLGAMEYDPAIGEIGRQFGEITGVKVNFYPAPAATLQEEINRTLSLGESEYDVLDPTVLWAFPDYLEAGWLAPITEAIPERQLDAWPDGLREAVTHDGEVYGAPHQIETMVWFYRKDLVEEARKEAGVKFPPKSWEEFVRLAKELTVDKDGDGSVDRWGFVYSANDGEMIHDNYSALVYASGGNMFNDDYSPAFNSEEGLDALQFMHDLVEEHKVTPPGVISMREGDLKDMFGADQAAIIQVDSSMLNAVKGTQFGDDVGMMKVVPRTKDTDAHYFVKGLTYVVNKNSNNLKAAKAYASYASSHVGNWLEGAVELNAPAIPSAYESPFYQDRYPEFEVVQEQLAKGLIPVTTNRFQMQDILMKGVQNAIRGAKAPSDALDWIVKRMEEEDTF